MASNVSIELIRELASLPRETEWVEFKTSLPSGKMIASNLSALANSCAYLGRPRGYLVWGVDDETHDLVGTTFDPYETRVGKGGEPLGSPPVADGSGGRASRRGNQLLGPWLASQISSNARYEFCELEDSTGRYVVLEVGAATGQPVTFQDDAYIRLGNSTVALRRNSALEQELWRRLLREGFERDVAAEHLSAGEVREVIDVDAFFVLTGLRQPSDGAGALEQLVAQELLRSTDDGRYDVTNLGALLLARNLRAFPGLAMRPIRVVRFAGRGSQEILGHADFVKGYALSLREAETYLMSSLPSHEERDGARRFVVYELPQPAVRELLTNAVIHQDLSYPYAGPFVGVHEGRIEFGNPGESLVAPEHVLNALPRERNKRLTTLLRLMGLCEASGTGWDLVVGACEAAHLPAPKMRSDADRGTVVTLYGERPYDRMKTSERLDATYWHACLRYAQDEELTNQSLRERFGERGHEPSSSAISRLIRLACERGLIKVSDAEASRKFRSYVPFWA